MKRLTIALLVSLFTAGCATQTEQFQQVVGTPKFNLSPDLAPTNGNAKIYVLRKSGFAGSGVAIRIADTGQPIGNIGSGGVLSWERAPGQVVVGASASNENNVAFSVASGDVVFIETRTNWGAGFNSAACEIRLLSNDDGRALLKQLQEK